MPRPRSQATTTLSPGQATYVLERLVAERRISPGEIYRYLGEIDREISSLEARLNSLRGASGGSSSGGGAAAPAGRRRGRRPGRPRGSKNAAPAAASAAPAAAAAPTGRRRGRPPGRPGRPGRPPGRLPGRPGRPPGGGKKRAALTPEQAASRQLQGRYLGLIRQIPANKRGQYQKTAKEKGREAAIKEMQEVLKK